MEMKQLTKAEVHAHKVAELGLDSDALDLTSTESIAAAFRRIASYLCPCNAATLVRSVIEPLRGLASDIEYVKGEAENTLDAMVAHGDFIEQAELDTHSSSDAARWLYAAPESFIARRSGAVILIGIPSGHTTLPEEFEGQIEYAGHVRRLNPLSGYDLSAVLTQLGFLEHSSKRWLKAPILRTPSQHLAFVDNLLDSTPSSREVPGLELLDPERPVGYYRGRWVDPRSQTGRFVGRRTQAYGAKLWSYIQLHNGVPERLIDFPVESNRWRGCDEAWRMQMAIDATRNAPQRFRVRPGPSDSVVIQFFSPVPMWARRKWDAVGEPVPSSGCLFAYKLPQEEVAEELRFIREELWLEELPVK